MPKASTPHTNAIHQQSGDGKIGIAVTDLDWDGGRFVEYIAGSQGKFLLGLCV